MDSSIRIERSNLIDNTKPKLSVPLVAPLVILFGIVRLPLLTRLPLFVDEGVHIWWAERALTGDILRSLNVGKPLEPAFIAPGLLLEIRAIWWARFVHVLAGSAILILLVILGRELQNPYTGWIGAFFYLIIPYAHFHDRIALTEVYVATAGLLVMWLAARALRTGDTQWTLVTGGALVLGFIAKMPTGLFFAIVPLVMGLFTDAFRSKIMKRKTLVVLYLPILITLTAIGTVAVYRFSRGLSPGFGLGLVMNRTSGAGPLLSVSRIITNLRLAFSWGATYFTLPLFILALVSLIKALLWGPSYDRSLAVLVIGAVGFFVGIANQWYPRYLVFTTPWLCLLMGGMVRSSFDSLTEHCKPGTSRVILALVTLILSVPAMRHTWIISTQPDKSPLPAVDRHQYIEGHAAGYGFPEAANWIADADPAVVVSLWVDTYTQLTTYLPETTKTRVIQTHIESGLAQDMNQRIARLLDIVKAHTNVFLITSDVDPGSMKPLEEIGLNVHLLASFPRPEGQTAVGVYQVSHSGDDL